LRNEGHFFASSALLWILHGNLLFAANTNSFPVEIKIHADKSLGELTPIVATEQYAQLEKDGQFTELKSPKKFILKIAARK
jgi:hypothetical protein